MRKVILIFGLSLLAMGLLFAQNQTSKGNKVAEGETNSPFGRFTVVLQDEPATLAGEKVRSYMITYENYSATVQVLVDKEENCKNYIVVSGDLSVMYKCNGKYFGVNRIDKKYNAEGYVTDDSNLNRTSYFHQKILVRGDQEEIPATTLIASFYPELLK